MEIRPGQQVGNYQLVKVLGKGGFAEVYLGEHIHLGTLAAIKLLTTRLSDEESNHFREEARTIARLRHPNIIRVLEFGVQNDLPYLVMDYAPQGTLRQRFVKGRQLDPLTILPYVQQVVGALQFAHDRKLIHRDVKPENMLLGENGEVLLSDFGIAVVAQSSRHQDMQEVVGTLAYMAPEQIQAHPRPASDQYSLGVVIYEWLTGARPFAGSMSEILAKQISTPPPPLRDKIPNVSQELELVVLTALEKDPKDRFASMRAFLKAFEQAIVAPGVATTPTYQVPTVGPAGGGLSSNAVSTPSAPANSAPSANWPSAPQVSEPSNWPSAPQSSQPSNWPSAPQASEPSGSGYPTVLSGPPAKPVDSNANFLDAPTVMGSFLPPTPENAQPFGPSAPGWQGGQAGAVLPGWQSSQPAMPSAPVQTGPTILSSGPVQTGPTILSSGPLQSGPTLFSPGPAAPGAPPMGTPPMGTPLVPPPAKPPEKGVSRRKVLIAGAAGIVGLAVIGGGVTWLVTSNNTTGQTGQTTTTATTTPPGKALYVYRGHTGAVRDIAWSIDGKRIATAGSDHTVQIWDALTGEHAFLSHSHTAVVRSLSFSPDKLYLATASDDKTVEIFTLATQTITFTYHGHKDAVLAVAWAPVGANIASGGLDQTVQIWSVASNDKPLFSFNLSGTTNHITSYAWSPDAKRLAGSSADGTIRIWNLTTKKVDVTYRGHTAGVNSVAWSPDGARLVSGSSDKRAIIWDANNGKTYGKDHSHTGSVDSVAWSPNGKYIATASIDATVQVLDAANYSLLRTYSGHTGAVYAIAWSPDSENVASAGQDGTAQVWKALPDA